jgi:hypothetical protein
MALVQGKEQNLNIAAVAMSDHGIAERSAEYLPEEFCILFFPTFSVGPLVPSAKKHAST